ncbi:MAG: flagellar basal body rod protein FlgC [Myxococcota bacterium]|nr:flagellar basal body rod protein FlgC [Myxococcota bacterium]
MNILDTLRISASGMNAQRVRMQTISSNIANARSTSSHEGEAYRRKMPIFKSIASDPFGNAVDKSLARVEVVDIEKSEAPFRQVFDPSHPDADDDGYVSYPNVDLLYEMVDMMTTSRTYEANTNAVETTYKMANLALEIAK